MRLRDYPWWPTAWGAIGGAVPTAGELSQGGTFITPRLVSNGLTLAVEYNGRQCTAVISHNAAPTDDPDFLRSLSKKLEKYRGKPFREVENLDI